MQTESKGEREDKNVNDNTTRKYSAKWHDLIRHKVYITEEYSLELFKKLA